jgi:hypothetical protein
MSCHTAGASIIRTIVSVLHDVLDKPPSVAMLLDKYLKVAIILDEVINEVRPNQGRGEKGCMLFLETQ